MGNSCMNKAEATEPSTANKNNKSNNNNNNNTVKQPQVPYIVVSSVSLSRK